MSKFQNFLGADSKKTVELTKKQSCKTRTCTGIAAPGSAISSNFTLPTCKFTVTTPEKVKGQRQGQCERTIERDHKGDQKNGRESTTRIPQGTAAGEEQGKQQQDDKNNARKSTEGQRKDEIAVDSARSTMHRR